MLDSVSECVLLIVAAAPAVSAVVWVPPAVDVADVMASSVASPYNQVRGRPSLVMGFSTDLDYEVASCSAGSSVYLPVEVLADNDLSAVAVDLLGCV